MARSQGAAAPTPAPAGTTPPTTVDAETLRDTLATVEALVNEGTELISGLVDLVLIAMEAPRFYNGGGHLAAALLTLRNQAEQLEGCVSDELEAVGCRAPAYQPGSAFFRRSAALFTATQTHQGD